MSKPSIPSLIVARQAELGLTDADLAAALGYPDARVIAMITKGHMRLPINKIRALADALELDAPKILRLTMGESAPGLLDSIVEVLDPLNLTRPEINLVQHCRKLAGGQEFSPLVLDGKCVIAIVTA